MVSLRRDLPAFIARIKMGLKPVRYPEKPHNLPSIYITLTSHRPRFGHLHYALRSLLSQSMKSDGVLLWIEEADVPFLPKKVLRLERHGLRIIACENGLRSYKKIIPALDMFPDAYLVTADDDYIYPQCWLEGLVEAISPGTAEILCYRAHTVIIKDGVPAPFREWLRETAIGERSKLFMPVGVGGVLYPPHIFDPRVTDSATFAALSPTGDDPWLYWMALLNGAAVRRVKAKQQMVRLPSSHIASLKEVNIANDQAVHQSNLDALLGRYGFPT